MAGFAHVLYNTTALPLTQDSSTEHVRHGVIQLNYLMTQKGKRRIYGDGVKFLNWGWKRKSIYGKKCNNIHNFSEVYSGFRIMSIMTMVWVWYEIGHRSPTFEKSLFMNFDINGQVDLNRPSWEKRWFMTAVVSIEKRHVLFFMPTVRARLQIRKYIQIYWRKTTEEKKILKHSFFKNTRREQRKKNTNIQKTDQTDG